MEEAGSGEAWAGHVGGRGGEAGVPGQPDKLARLLEQVGSVKMCRCRNLEILKLLM